MMQLIHKTIVDKLPDLVDGAGGPLSFLKYSTPTSGKSLNDKVIFFVFKPREKVPFLCVKTVRSYDAREIIIRNFDNLKKINTLTASSPYFDLFAQALYLHDDGENIFSIETICPGKRIKLNKKKLSFVVAEYIGFQEYLAKNSSESVSDIKDFVKEIISKSKLKELDQQKLLQFTETLPLDNVKLPRLIQHGDVTEDNILLSKKRLCIIDYDFVGVTDLPGFDLFGLFSRFNQSEVKELCYKYFPKYFSRIDVDVESNKYKGLLFLYFLIERILRKPHPLENESAEKIISDFKDMTI
ncbi:MAG: phosphotransferase [Candidatus Scalindua sp.]|nr:phosphotransferase [Candidatus Scalindua sp.]